MKKTTIGGQALIEGLMMIGPKYSATAIRKPDGEIVVDKKPLPAKSKWSKIPLIRGVVNFVRQMVLGVKALMYSADFMEYETDEDNQSKLDKFIDKILGDKAKNAAIIIAVVISIAFSIGLFILLPNFIVSLISPGEKTTGGVILINLLEGVIRLVLLFSYLLLASRMKDIKRVWQYHGAEHKTIHAYEHGEELTVVNVQKYTTKHPRCGTSFLFIVMLISIVVFSFIGWHSVWINILVRLLLVPLVAGISYEILRAAGRSEWKGMKFINAPGLALQRITTKEPDDSMVEVAIAAFSSVLVAEDENADKW
ncbi:MAG: DUF1385 domain-containing protein [Eubacteriales bacterium]|nr:DUF1385 domain-containing protein [Eubacteriales bacterium]